MARFTVTQPDSRTIRVDADGGSFRLPYRFFWDGHEREPESVRLDTGQGRAEVRAYFLFGSIVDSLSCDAHGVTIARTWSVKSIGTVRLSVDVEFDAADGATLVFPGVSAGEPLPGGTACAGDRTSYPLSVLARRGRSEALVWSDSPAVGGKPASIGAFPMAPEEGPPVLRVQVRAPGIGLPFTRVGPRPADVRETAEAVIESAGDLEARHRLFVAFAPAGEIQVRGAAAVLARLHAAHKAEEEGDDPQAHPPEQRAEETRARARGVVDRERLREALSACLSTHLVQAGGVAGLREVPGSTRLSPAAGVEAAVLVRTLFPGDERLAELALRLADFALKGQHPSGMFFTAYDQKSGEWQGVRGRSGGALLSVAEAARTADGLLALAENLAEAGLPHEKYWLAGARFAESFTDEKLRLRLPGSLHAPSGGPPAEPGLGGFALFSPLARVCARSRRDRHKRPLDDLARAFSAMPWDSFAPPRSREGRDADAEAALLAARLFVEMRGRGYRPVEATGGTPAVQKKRAAQAVRLFASLLVPWVRIEAAEGGAAGARGGRGAGHPDGTGMLADSFTRQRLLPACHETAWLLLSLRGLAADPGLCAALRRLALLCIDASSRLAVGTSWLRHTDWDAEGRPGPAAGPVDSRRLVREVGFGLRIVKDFPRA
jgi:hypothetical protein